MHIHILYKSNKSYKNKGVEIRNSSQEKGSEKLAFERGENKVREQALQIYFGVHNF